MGVMLRTNSLPPSFPPSPTSQQVLLPPHGAHARGPDREVAELQHSPEEQPSGHASLSGLKSVAAVHSVAAMERVKGKGNRASEVAHRYGVREDNNYSFILV